MAAALASRSAIMRPTVVSSQSLVVLRGGLGLGARAGGRALIRDKVEELQFDGQSFFSSFEFFLHAPRGALSPRLRSK